MKKITILAALIAFSFTPFTVAQAEESSAKVSYSKKKAGGVPFYSDEETASEETAATEETAPADIEPAAGAQEPQEEEGDDLSKSMKLPRK